MITVENRKQVISEFEEFVREMARRYRLTETEVRRIVLRQEMGKYVELEEYASQF